MKTNIHSTDIEELAAHLCGLNYDDVDYSDIAEAIYDKFEINYLEFEKLIMALVTLIDVGQSPLTKKRYKGFSKKEGKHMVWLLKVETE